MRLRHPDASEYPIPWCIYVPWCIYLFNISSIQVSTASLSTRYAHDMLMNPYHAIADPNRRQMLDLLRHAGPLRAGEIVAHFPEISQPAVSKHLRVLRQARLVRSEKQGREQWYSLDPMPLLAVAQWLGEYENLWTQRLERLKQVAEQGAHANAT